MKNLTILAALVALIGLGTIVVAGDEPTPTKAAPEKREPCADCPGAGCADCPAKGCADCADGKACAGCAAKDAGEAKLEPKVGDDRVEYLGDGPMAPDFSGRNLEDELLELSGYAGKWVILEWINHGCPFVKKHYDAGNMQALQKKYTGEGAVWISICSSAPGKQGHMSVEEWKRVQMEKGAAPTEVILDPDGKIGRLYKAGRTPHMVVIDPVRRIVYEGAIDDKPRAFKAEEVKAATNYLAVFDAVWNGKESPVRSKPAYGCSVKYAR